MASTPEIERAAQIVAERVKTLVIAMLDAGELGEVAVVVGYFDLKPEKRVTTEGKAVKVARGQTAIERMR